MNFARVDNTHQYVFISLIIKPVQELNDISRYSKFDQNQISNMVSRVVTSSAKQVQDHLINMR
jgi:hypothetical protein